MSRPHDCDDWLDGACSRCLDDERDEARRLRVEARRLTEGVPRVRTVASIGTVPLSLDRCPTCGRRITDYDDDGCESPDGQRYCRAHVAVDELLGEARRLIANADALAARLAELGPLGRRRLRNELLDEAKALVEFVADVVESRA